MNIKLISTVTVLLFCDLNAQEEIISTANIKPFLNLYSGIHYTIHNIDSVKYKENIKYESEDFGSYVLDFDAGIFGHSILKFDYEKTFPSGDFQTLAIQENIESRSGLERYTFGIKLDPLIKYLLPDNTLITDIVSTIFSLRFRYIQELTQNTGTVLVESRYLGDNSFVDYEKNEVSNAQTLPQWSHFTFRTWYYYRESSIHLFTISGKGIKQSDLDFRVGYSSAQFSRPSNTTYITLASQPIVYNTNFYSKAIFLSMENIDYGYPGLNLEFLGSYGIDNSMTGTFDWKKHIGGDNIKIRSYRLELNMWYNLYFKQKGLEGLFLKLGLSGHGYNTDVILYPGDNETIIAESDSFWKLWAELSWRIQ